MRSYNICGESVSVNCDLNIERQKLRVILKDYKMEDIHNFDETGLFYRMRPDRTLATGPIFGQKKIKQRITIGL